MARGVPTVAGMLEIQRYLRSGGTIQDLAAKYGIKAKRHMAHGNLVQFKYSMIDSPMSEQIVRECRGIILDADHAWQVVAHPFQKFFNHGEAHADQIDWSTARVQEKLDGSLCIMYEYNGEWNVATSGTPDASGDINGAGTRFSDYFWDAFDGMGAVMPDLGDPATGDMTFMFELTGPLNRVVVVHDKPTLTLIGARNRVTGQEVRASSLAPLLKAIPAVREFPLVSMEQIGASFATMSPLAQEGYVVVDDAFRRVKVKHPGYVALHHAKDGMTQRAFVEIARSGEVSEVAVAFPQFAPMVAEAKRRVDALAAEVEADYARLKDIPVQKDFALKATATRCPAALFQIRAGRVATARAHFVKMPIDNLMGLLGY